MNHITPTRELDASFSGPLADIAIPTVPEVPDVHRIGEAGRSIHVMRYGVGTTYGGVIITRRMDAGGIDISFSPALARELARALTEQADALERGV